MKSYASKNLLDAFVSELGFLTHPELRLKDWLDTLRVKKYSLHVFHHPRHSLVVRGIWKLKKLGSCSLTLKRMFLMRMYLEITVMIFFFFCLILKTENLLKTGA